MSKGCARALSFIFLIGLFSITLFTNPAKADWSGEITVQFGDIPGDPDLRELGSCGIYEAALSYVRNVRSHSSSLATYAPAEGYEEIVNTSTSTQCMTRNKNGYFYNNWWAPERPGKAIELQNIGGSIVAAPNTDAYLHLKTIPRSRTYTVSLESGFGPGVNGKLGVRSVGRDHLKTFEFDTSGLNTPLAYETGETVRTDPYRIWFSKNGRFAVLNVYARGFAVLDLEEQTLTPFYKLPVSRFSTLSASISSDGKTVSITDSIPQVFNLERCQSYSFDSIPANMFDTLPIGCESVFDATDLLRSDLNTYSGSMGAWLNQRGDKLIHDRRIPGTDTFRRYEFYPSSLAADDGSYSGLEGYLALGDSFASGEGDTDGNNWYESGTNVHGDVSSRNLCHVSRRSYSYLIARNLGFNKDLDTPAGDGLFHSVACSGAKIHNVIGGSVGENHRPLADEDLSFTDNQAVYVSDRTLGAWQKGVTTQKNHLISGEEKFVERLDSSFTPEVVTLSIGGNDIGFSDIIKACLLPGTCEYAKQGSAKMNRMVNRVAHQKDELAKTYREIKQASPGTRVYVTGYPVFASDKQDDCGLNVRFNDEERKLLEEGVLYMNQVVRAAAAEAGVFYVEIGHSLLNHTLCSSSDMIAFNGFAFGDDQDLNELCFSSCIGNESYHPNEFGHELIKNTIMNSTNNLANAMPEPVEVDIPLPSDYFGLTAVNNVRVLNDGGALIPSVVSDNAKYLIDLSVVEIEHVGLMPGSLAEVIVESDPISLGEFEVDNNGRLSIKVELPENLAPGYHELRIVATSMHGQKNDYYTSFVTPYSNTDFDGDGISDEDDVCSLIQDSGQDVDQDNTDDACDFHISQTLAQNDDKTDSSESNDQAKIIPVSNSNPPGVQLIGNDADEVRSIGVSLDFDETDDNKPTDEEAQLGTQVLGAANSPNNSGVQQSIAAVMRTEKSVNFTYVLAGAAAVIIGSSLVILRIVKKGS